ncbi:MAG TPA: bifunctional alpha,alpha-trehalose-phosphate synthase (UDP-forming)/trehalose-phosphatase [Polyangiaceae bacterium]|nr:bifunctional alpha,alpha-trehalose-phosphate synthase (UDP-forming)/trehalose-phosphatase [Polyangiaceae bacterium]
MSRLIVISNRLPFTLQNRDEGFELVPSAGGLVSALGAYLEGRRRDEPDFECIWVGWVGSSVPAEREQEVRQLALEAHSAFPLFLSPEDMNQFYLGFCNNTLWPLFHYFPSYVDYNPEHWATYVRVNGLFRDAVLELLRPDDTIWVHDYQLMLLPGLLRQALPDASIGFFLHIPFPSHELFRLLPTPWKRQLLEGMLGADLLGFHTHEYTQYFLHCVFRTLGHDHHLGQIAMGDTARRADTFPIGIDFDKFMTAAGGTAVAERRREIEASIHGRQAIFSVDRLDYTKGILNRLKGFEQFLLRYPEWHDKVVFLLAVIPSRAEVLQYQRMKQELDEKVGQINGRFGTVNWVPIVYQYRSLDFDTLVALYQMSPVALITPLRDGMNLVAKEYLASKPDGLGVLVLSEMAGAARELGEALLINPNHWEEIADALQQALTLDADEQIRRNRPMQQRLKAYDARRWATHFLSSLSRVKQHAELATRRLSEELQQKVRESHQAAERPLLFLDYDGTLVPFAAEPHLARPDPELLALLAELAEEKRNRIFLISGRERATLDDWFSAVGVGLIAEHGAWIREHGGDWHLHRSLASGWRDSLLPILRLYVDQVAGSLLEEKDFSIAWHYRRCDPELGAQRAKELIDEVTQFTANLEVQVLEGKKVVEIRNSGVNKGVAAAKLVGDVQPDFVLAIGDDQTDEDLFRALPPSAFTVRVGMPFSRARYSLNDYREVRSLLCRLLRNPLSVARAV